MTEIQSLTDRVRQVVAAYAGVETDTVTVDVTLDGDLSLYGDDIHDLLELFATEFGVDMTRYRWYHHTGPEGCNPLWLFRRPWWDKKKKIPIRVADLVESAARKHWAISYDIVRGNT